MSSGNCRSEAISGPSTGGLAAFFAYRRWMTCSLALGVPPSFTEHTWWIGQPPPADTDAQATPRRSDRDHPGRIIDGRRHHIWQRLGAFELDHDDRAIGINREKTCRLFQGRAYLTAGQQPVAFQDRDILHDLIFRKPSSARPAARSRCGTSPCRLPSLIARVPPCVSPTTPHNDLLHHRITAAGFNAWPDQHATRSRDARTTKRGGRSSLPTILQRSFCDTPLPFLYMSPRLD